MNKIKYKILILLMLGVPVFSVGFSQKSYAASQDECAIWLCLPGGFPAGCSAAYESIRRPKPYFIEMWANDEYIGKFFYQ